MKEKAQGFAILIIAVTLSVAGMLCTVKMAQHQLMDNQILGNYYRNREAFVNAESGVNLILSKLNSVTIASQMLNDLPFIYPEKLMSDIPYQVVVEQIEDNKLQITSTGKSQDASATRVISLQIYYSTAFNVPIAPISSNGKLNIDSTSTINDGCEGVAKADCRSAGNISALLMVTQPSAEQEVTDLCTGDSFQANSISNSAIYGSVQNDDGESRFKEITDNEWGVANSADGSVFEQVASIENMNDASSLFESTFGVTLQDAKDELGSSGVVARIDMNNTGGLSCSEQLLDVDDEISVIYIKGDCDIEQKDASQSSTSENKRLTIGSVENPKMVFIEGGSFVTQPNTGFSVIGMLYFIPGSSELVDVNGDPIYVDGVKQSQEDQSVDMGGVRVNGALLSEYNCSADGYDKTDNKGTKQHFSSRYDRVILNRLYDQIGMTASATSYQLVEGSWRDF